MKIRTKCPKNNKYYIRKVTGGLNEAVAGEPTQPYANVLDNCVGYANGRYNEIINDPDLKGIVKAFKYQLTCNAENFIESAKRQGLKISPTPIEGGIMVWQKGATLNGGDGAGHVAVVERVYEDGSILTSESGWASWAFKTVRRDNTNGRWGQNEYYRFRGCIINPSVKNPKVVPVPPLTVDGEGGTCTVRAMQRFFGTPQDGVISGQNRNCSKYYPSLSAVEYGKGGSACVKKLQKWVGTTQDGVLGEQTVKAWQKKLGVDVDGVFGTKSMKAWQKYLNEHEKAVYPKSAKQVIDVSEFQSAINWKKVKADNIEGVIIRCGYRGAEKGTLQEDSMFFEHITGAHKAGLKIGVYMFTEGINAAEGKAEAVYALNLIKKAGIHLSYPIAVDTEDVYYTKNGKRYPGRANGLSRSKRTEVIKAFCEEIKSQGYEPMIYASTSWLNNKLDMSKLPYTVWVAQYYSKCEYKGKYLLWQYTSEGHVDGIKGDVDMNKYYPAKKEDPPTNGEKIASKGWEYAYHTNTKDAAYPKGKPVPAYKTALNTAFGKIRRWSTPARLGASCDVFIATCIRMAGIDKKAPRGLGRKNYFDKSDKFRRVSVTASTIQDGDIISIIWSNGKMHWCMAYKGKVLEASYGGFYPKTQNCLKSRLSKSGKQSVVVYRAK